MRFLFLNLFITLFLLSACTSSEQTSGQHEHHHNGHHQQHDEHTEADNDRSPLEELYWSRLQESRMNFTQADTDFMTDMIIHHAQALIMSELAPGNDAHRQVQTLAARIINAQKDEIALMQKWLRDRNQPVPLVSFEGLEMIVEMESLDDHNHDHHGHDQDHHGHHHDMSHHHDMPGMLTQEQLEHLASVTGRDFDRYFLKYMIEHHEGAVIMVYDLFETDGAANDREAYQLATDIYAEQVTEINRMHLMLEEMGLASE